MLQKDPYAVLGIARDADYETVNAAYRILAKKYHPDLNPDEGAAMRMREINEAYHAIRSHDAAFAGDAWTMADGNADYTVQEVDGDASGYRKPFGTGNRRTEPYRRICDALERGAYGVAEKRLSEMVRRDEFWYYYAACAQNGCNNHVLALHYAKTAHELDPYEPIFEELYLSLRGTVTENRVHADKCAAIRDTVKRVLILICALCMIGGTFFRACMMG